MFHNIVSLKGVVKTAMVAPSKLTPPPPLSRFTMKMMKRPAAKEKSLKRPAAKDEASGDEDDDPVFDDPKTKAQQQILNVAQGSKSQRDRQGVMNHLNSLANGGNTKPREKYKSLANPTEKRNFVKSLALDFQAAFVQITEELQAKTSVSFGEKEGWLYEWEVAREEGIPYDKNNRELILAICHGYRSEEPKNERLRENGYLVYWYEKEGLVTRTNTGNKSMQINKTSTVHDEKDAEQIEEALHRAIGDKHFSGKMAAAPQAKAKAKAGGKEKGKEKGKGKEQEPKKVWLKAASKSRSELNAAIDHGKILMTKLGADSTVFSKKFKEQFASRVAKLQEKQNALLKQIAAAEVQSDDVFNQKKPAAELYAIELENFQDMFLSVADKQFTIPTQAKQIKKKAKISG